MTFRKRLRFCCGEVSYDLPIFHGPSGPTLQAAEVARIRPMFAVGRHDVAAPGGVELSMMMRRRLKRNQSVTSPTRILWARRWKGPRLRLAPVRFKTSLPMRSWMTASFPSDNRSLLLFFVGFEGFDRFCIKRLSTPFCRHGY